MVLINADPGLGSPGIATIIIVTGTGPYSQLNRSQYNITFYLMLFDISLNINSDKITVQNAGITLDIDPIA